MRYVGGIDGGQTATKAAIVGEDGTVVAHGTGPPSDDVGERADSRRLAKSTAQALRTAAHAAGLDDVTFAAIVVGISGFEGRLHGAEPELPSPVVRYVHDAPIALAGALGGEPGIVVIAGTGSIAYGEDAAGANARAGGWGYIFGDAGSSFALARDALALAMAAEDRGETSALAEAALAFFEEPDLRSLVRSVYTGAIDRPQVAAFARLVDDALRLGRAEVEPLFDAAAAALAGIAEVVAARLDFPGPIPVALTGGGFGSSRLAGKTSAALAERVPRAQVVSPQHEPAVGAALLAFDAAGLARPRDIRGSEGG